MFTERNDVAGVPSARTGRGSRNIFPKSSDSENGGKQPFLACPLF